MKRSLVLLLLIASVFVTVFAQDSKKDIKRWFKKKEWLHGANITPHKSLNQAEFYRQYKLNPSYWDKAFQYLATTDLNALPVGKSNLDGDNVTVSVTDDPSKDLDKTNWESHKKYADIQMVISGEEKIGVADASTSKVTKEYDDKKDVMNYAADAAGKFYSAKPRNFFIFFPSDAHRPNITPGGNLKVKKIVLKVRVS